MLLKIIRYLKIKLRYLFKNQLNKKDIAISKGKNFVIICNNCWGRELYHWFNRPYNSPFIGLFLYGPCYIKLLSNFEYYMGLSLNFVPVSKYPDRPVTYPLAMLGDLEIHFTHYTSEEEARYKWEKRTKKMSKEKDYDNFYFKICDRERVSPLHLKMFHNLSFKNKISFAKYDFEYVGTGRHIKIKESNKKDLRIVPNGKKLFKLTYFYIDISKWLFHESLEISTN